MAKSLHTDLRPIIGTLAYNRRFTAQEITEYTHGRFDGAATIKALLRKGFISRLGRGEYYPTGKGWLWIDKMEEQ